MTFTRSCLLALCLFAALPAAAEDLTPQKRADIERLLEMTGSAALGKQMAVQMVTQMTHMLHQARPDIPQRVLDMLPGEIQAVIEDNMDGFRALTIPLYHKYFSGDEIKQMIQFYSSPLGQKSIQVMPALMSESMALGQQWGRSLGPAIEERVKSRIRKEGFTI